MQPLGFESGMRPPQQDWTGLGLAQTLTLTAKDSIRYDSTPVADLIHQVQQQFPWDARLGNHMTFADENKLPYINQLSHVDHVVTGVFYVPQARN